MAQSYKVCETCEPGNAITLSEGIRLQVRQVTDTGLNLLLVTPREKAAASHAAAPFALHGQALPLPRVRVRGHPPSCKTCPLTARSLAVFQRSSTAFAGMLLILGGAGVGEDALGRTAVCRGNATCARAVPGVRCNALQGRWLHCGDPKLALTHSISSSGHSYEICNGEVVTHLFSHAPVAV